MLIPLGNELYGDAVYSTDDGGWYVDLFDEYGKDVDQTELCDSENDAIKAARVLAQEHSN